MLVLLFLISANLEPCFTLIRTVNQIQPPKLQTNELFSYCVLLWRNLKIKELRPKQAHGLWFFICRCTSWIGNPDALQRLEDDVHPQGSIGCLNQGAD